MNHQFMRFKSAFIKDGEMWCVPISMNWLFKINLNDWSIESICNLELDDEYHIDYIYLYKNIVWCVTSTGVKVIGYDMRTGKIEHYEMKSGEEGNRGTILYDKELWIFPIELSRQLISFDIEKKEFIVHSNWKKECLRWNIKGRSMFFCHIGNTVYIPLRDECKVIQYHLEDETIGVHNFQGQSGFRCILQIRDEFYAISFSERMLFRWNEKTEETKKIYCPYSQDRYYVKAVEFQQKILLTDGRNVDIFDIKKGEISPYKHIPAELRNECDDQEASRWHPLFFDILTCDGKYYLLPWRANMILEFTEGETEWKGHTLRIPEELFFKEFVQNRIQKFGVIIEDEITLYSFQRYVASVKGGYQEDMEKKQIGCEIYQKMEVYQREGNGK